MHGKIGGTRLGSSTVRFVHFVPSVPFVVSIHMYAHVRVPITRQIRGHGQPPEPPVVHSLQFREEKSVGHVDLVQNSLRLLFLVSH